MANCLHMGGASPAHPTRACGAKRRARNGRLSCHTAHTPPRQSHLHTQGSAKPQSLSSPHPTARCHRPQLPPACTSGTSVKDKQGPYSGAPDTFSGELAM